jgi:hypothetical protein
MNSCANARSFSRVSMVHKCEKCMEGRYSNGHKEAQSIAKSLPQRPKDLSNH